MSAFEFNDFRLKVDFTSMDSTAKPAYIRIRDDSLSDDPCLSSESRCKHYDMCIKHDWLCLKMKTYIDSGQLLPNLKTEPSRDIYIEVFGYNS